MTIKEMLSHFESLSNEKVRAHNIRYGAGSNHYGVKLGDIRVLAKKLKTNHSLALALWKTENVEARLLATLLIKPADLSADELDSLVRSERFTQVADWLNAYVIRAHPAKDDLREQWMTTDHPRAARAGWSLTADMVVKQPEKLDIPALLDRIEKEMPTAAPEVQWTMNTTLAQIGIHHPTLRERALALGEKMGVYRDFPVSKGCTSPFAPIWINEMVRRQGDK